MSLRNGLRTMTISQNKQVPFGIQFERIQRNRLEYQIFQGYSTVYNLGYLIALLRLYTPENFNVKAVEDMLAGLP